MLNQFRDRPARGEGRLDHDQTRPQTLPQVDRELFGFEQWLHPWLNQVEDPEHRKILTRYATWQVLRQLRAVADHGPIGRYRQQTARYRLRQAAAWLRGLEYDGQTLESTLLSGK